MRKMCLCVLLLWVCRGANGGVFETLLDFRKHMYHAPGNIGFAHGGSSLKTGCGTVEELNRAFEYLMQAQGIGTRWMSGSVSMSSAQVAAWVADIGSCLELGGTLGDDGNWTVPFTWLQCKASYMPLLMGGIPSGQEWIDVFPGLLHTECIAWQPLELEELLVQQLSGISHRVAWNDAECLVGSCECVGETQRFTRQFLNQQADKHIVLPKWTTSGSMPGYCSGRVQSLTPVEILASQIISPVSPANVKIELLSGDSVILEAMVFHDADDEGLVELQWRKTEETQAPEDAVHGMSVCASVAISGKEYVATGNIEAETTVRLRLTVLAKGQAVETVSDEVVAGNAVVYCISSGHFLIEEESDDTYCARVRNAARRLRYGLDEITRVVFGVFPELERRPLLVSKVSYTQRVDESAESIADAGVTAGSCGDIAGNGVGSWALYWASAAVAEYVLTSHGTGVAESSLGQLRRMVSDGRCGMEGGASFLLVNDNALRICTDAKKEICDAHWKKSSEQNLEGQIASGHISEKRMTASLEGCLEETASCLCLVKELQSRGVLGCAAGVDEVVVASVFSTLGERLEKRSAITAFEVKEVVDAQPVGNIGFSFEQTVAWTADIVSSDGTVVFSQQGWSDGEALQWQGNDAQGTACADGSYVCRLTMEIDGCTLTEKRDFLWDVTAPATDIQTSVRKVEGTNVVDASFAAADDHFVSASIHILDVRTHAELSSQVLAQSTGTCVLNLPENGSNAFIVEFRAYDSMGNLGTARSTVLTGLAYVGGRVIGSTADSSAAEELACALEAPQANDGVSDGLLTVQGSVSHNDSAVTYQIRVRDSQGRLLDCQGETKEGHWQLSYWPSQREEQDIELTYPSSIARITSGELGWLDLTALRGGAYTVELVAFDGGSVQAESAEIFLESSFCIGENTYSEKDGTVSLGGVSMGLQRMYSSVSDDNALGHGWTLTLDTFDIEMHDERSVLESIDGERVSVRTGGSRDVTLTLPTGQRTTFEFSLEPGGGMSFAYYGQWKTTGKHQWRLRASVDSNVTVLPGLEPYWNSAGLGVPLEYFDFPGYLLEAPDGTVYEFDCAKLGDYDAVDDEGGSYSLTCYDTPRLSQIRFSDGSSIELAEDSLRWHDEDGNSWLMLEKELDEAGRIAAIHFKDGSGTVLRYAYSADGNLVSYSKGIGGEEPTLRRVYRYENTQNPHLLTQVENASGCVLAAFEYDMQGRLVSQGNGMGGTASVEHEPFSRTEVVTDSAGNDTVLRYDSKGNTVETVYPDGTVERRSYDADGRVTRRVDECGGVTEWQYDDAGHLLARTDALGGVTSYAYNENGQCYQVTDPLGRSMVCQYAEDGRHEETTFPSGVEFVVDKDSDGHPTHYKLGEMDTFLTYLDGGKAARLSGKSGEDVEIAVDVDGSRKTYTYSWLGIDQERESLSSEVTVDAEGRQIYLCDSFGNTQEFERDDDGRVVRESDQMGRWVQWRYNAAGKEVEYRTAEGYVRRIVYDGAGRLLLIAGPEKADYTEGTMVFSSGRKYEYDCRGRVVAECVMTGCAIGLRALGGGQYETVLGSAGTEYGAIQREYDGMGRVCQEVSLDGRHRQMEYDALGRVVKVADVNGGEVHYRYDALGNILSMSDGAGNITAQWEYDAHGYMKKYVEADGRVHNYETAPGGKVVLHEADGCAPISVERDGSGQALSTRQGTMKIDFEHDDMGNLLSITDALGHCQRYHRDVFGRLVRSVSQEGREVRWSYVSCLCDAVYVDGGEGLREELQLDNDGQWQRKRIWDSAGNLHEILRESEDDRRVLENSEECWRDSYENDSQGRVAARLGNGQRLCTYSYDPLGRISCYASSDTDIGIHYGINGTIAKLVYERMDAQTLDNAMELDIRYDDQGRVIGEISNDGWSRTFDYDCIGRIACEKHFGDNGQTYGSIWHYDDGGRSVERVEELADGSRTTVYAYDSIGQLVSEIQTLDDQENYRWSGRYDSVGNLIEETVVTADDTVHVVHQMDGDNCLTESRFSSEAGEWRVGYTWDAMGNLTQEQCSGSQQWENDYIWDGAGMLRRWIRREGTMRTEVSFLYDGYGLLRGHVCREYADGILQDEIRHDFIHERTINAALPKIMSYRVRTAEKDAAVTVLNIPRARCFTAWGESLDDGDASGIGAWGEWHEVRSGLVYLRERFYSPRLRRFISMDPVPGKDTEPRSFHRYAYCMNDPVNRRDPQGTMSLPSVTTSMSMSLSLYPPHVMTLKEVALLSCTMASEIELCRELYITYGTADLDNCYGIRMQSEFPKRVRLGENATVFVHGMAYHEAGWADDMIGKFREGGVNNQDYYTFLWSGFAASSWLFIPVPIRVNHNIALDSLTLCLKSLYVSGYEKINVISHSWGTVLSRDALSQVGKPVGLWATMGSPLCEFTPPFIYNLWLNVFNVPDPVTRAAPLLITTGYVCCAKPLCYYGGPSTPLEIDDQSSYHSAYWTNEKVCKRIGDYFKQQPK